MQKVYRIIISSLVSVLLLQSCDTSETVEPSLDSFVKLYGEDGNQFGVDIEQLPNKDLIILGRIEETQTTTLMLLRIDPIGNVIWKNKIHDENPATSEVPKAMVIDEDQNILIVGDYVEGSNRDIFLYRITPSGEMESFVTYDINSGNRIDIAEDITTFNGDSYMISGHSRATSTSAEEFFMLRVDRSLSRHPDWLNEIIPYSTTAGQNAFSRTGNNILFFRDNLMLTVITSNRIDASTAGTNIEISYVNDNGLPDYPGNQERQYAGTDYDDEVNGLSATANGFAFIGTVLNPASSSIIYGEVSSGGAKTNEVVLNNPNVNRNLRGVDVGQLQAGRLLLLGEERVSADNTNLYMAEVDNFGTIYWEHAYGGNDIDNAAALLIDGNTVYAVGTLKLSSQNKILLIKTDARGRL